MTILNFKEMYQKICNLEEGLTTWEVGFIESISCAVANNMLSDKQKVILVDIYYKRC
jgi:hypothetical protein